MHMVNLKFDFNHLTVQKWIRNTKILHSNSLISLLIRSGTSRAIGMNSGYHATMADYLLLIWNCFIFSLWYIALPLWTRSDQYIYSNPHLRIQTPEASARKLKNNLLLWLTTYFFINRFIFSLWYIPLQLWTHIDQYIYTAIHIYKHLKLVQANWKTTRFYFVSMVCR